MSKVVVISTSLRAGSNSHAMAEQFAAGAKDAGHEGNPKLQAAYELGRNV